MKYLLIGALEEAICPFKDGDAFYVATSRIRSSCPIVSPARDKAAATQDTRRGTPSRQNRSEQDGRGTPLGNARNESGDLTPA